MEAFHNLITIRWIITGNGCFGGFRSAIASILKDYTWFIRSSAIFADSPV